MYTGFHAERGEGQYRLYFNNVFLGFFDTYAEVKHEVKLRKEHAQENAEADAARSDDRETKDYQ